MMAEATQAETPELAALLTQANQAYSKAEGIGGRAWAPPVAGRWKSHLSSFTYESRETRDKKGTYLGMRLGVTIDEGGLPDGRGDEFRGRECFIYFDDLQTGSGTNKDFWGLRRLKGLTAILNEDESIDDLASSIQFMEAVVTDQMEVYLKASARGYKDRNTGEDRTAMNLEIDGVVEKPQEASEAVETT